MNLVIHKANDVPPEPLPKPLRIKVRPNMGWTACKRLIYVNPTYISSEWERVNCLNCLAKREKETPLEVKN